MKQVEILEFIRQVELFADFTDEELNLVLEHIEVKEFAPKSLLFSQRAERKHLYMIFDGEVELISKSPFGEENRITYFRKYDFIGEGAILDNAPHSTSGRAVTNVIALVLENADMIKFFEKHGSIAVKVLSCIAKVISRRISHSNARIVNAGAQYISGRTREESDLLGTRKVPSEFLYGVQTLRAIENFTISGVTLAFHPTIIEAFAMVKKAAAKANCELGLMDEKIENAISEACTAIMNGRYHKHFAVDMIQGGAGTSTNMNANEVIANIALEILGHQRGEYQHCHPNDHVNCSQSTNDAYPTAVKIALYNSNKKLTAVLKRLVDAFYKKATEFSDIIKMGRTQLQDAVPMTMGQEFEAYAVTLEEEIRRLSLNANLFLEVNMGATAIGTGINAHPEYGGKVINHLREITGHDIELARNLVEATQDTGAFIMFSSAVKRLAIKLSKICNDLRLLSSGPRTGINEINLPPMQPGSSIMPGKVNPVIPEVVNQIAFKVIGNDLTINLASEAGQLELNVMEPVIVHSLFESMEMLKNGMETLQYRCIEGITANKERCEELVINSIGLVTALVPIIGYKNSSAVAKEALATGRGVYELILEKELLSKERLDEILKPENMIRPNL